MSIILIINLKVSALGAKVSKDSGLFSLSFKRKIYFILGVWLFLLVHMYVHDGFVWFPRRPEDTGFMGTGVTCSVSCPKDTRNGAQVLGKNKRS